MPRTGSLLAPMSIALMFASNMALSSSLHAQIALDVDGLAGRTGTLADVCALLSQELEDDAETMIECMPRESPLAGFSVLEAKGSCLSTRYALIDTRSTPVRVVTVLARLSHPCSGGTQQAFELSGVRRFDVGSRSIVMLESKSTFASSDRTTMINRESLYKYVTFCVDQDRELRTLRCRAYVAVRHVGMEWLVTDLDAGTPSKRWDWKVSFAILSTGRVLVQPRVGVWPEDESAGSPSMFSLW